MNSKEMPDVKKRHGDDDIEAGIQRCSWISRLKVQRLAAS